MCLLLLLSALIAHISFSIIYFTTGEVHKNGFVVAFNTGACEEIKINNKMNFQMYELLIDFQLTANGFFCGNPFCVGIEPLNVAVLPANFWYCCCCETPLYPLP